MTTGRRPRVSIGLPVYNGERYLAESLDSLLRQTFDDFELIICDNASVDGTEEICRGYVARDRRIRYVRHATNLGASRNFRISFEMASGEYFKWAACDDLHGPQFLARCVDVLDRDPAVVLVYPKSQLIDEDGRVLSDYEDGLHLTSPRPSERFIRLVETLGLCNAAFGLLRPRSLRRTALLAPFIASDVPLLAELTLYGTFWEVPERLFYRRFHPSASSRQTDTKLLTFFDPGRAQRVPLTAWHHVWANLVAVERAPIPQGEKMRLRRFILRMARWRRDELLAELWVAVRWLAALHVKRVPS